MVDEQYTSSIVRIYKTAKASEKVKTPKGLGFLVDNKHILTCAHVVARALGIADNTVERPPDTLCLDFPFVNSTYYTARVIFWRPYVSDEQGGEIDDIAVLELDNAKPKGAISAGLTLDDNLSDHKFTVWGYPSGYEKSGIWAYGLIRGKLANRRFQVEHLATEEGIPVQPGFSGSPVLDLILNDVIGMVVQAAKGVGIAFVIPTDVLIESWADLKIAIVTAWMDKGDNLNKLGDFEKAVECYDKALNVDLFAVDAWNHKGNSFFKMRQYDKAIESYSKALDIDPTNVDGWNGKGNSYERLESFEDALKCFDNSLEINPENSYALKKKENILLDYPDLLNSRISNYNEKKPEKKAQEWIEKGDELFDMHCYEEALSDYNRALVLNPTDPTILSRKAKVLTYLDRHKEAIGCCDAAIKIDEFCVDAYINKAMSLKRTKHYSEALKCCAKAIEIDPKNAVVFALKGSLYSDLNNYKEALKHLDIAIHIDQNNPNLWCTKARSLYTASRYDDAIICYDKAVKIAQRHSEAWIGKGMSFAQLGHHDEAIECFDKALEVVDEGHVEAWYNKGMSCAKVGRLDEALECFDKALDINPTDVRTLLINGTYLALAGQDEKAMQCFDTVLELEPRNLEAKKQKEALETKLTQKNLRTWYQQANELTKAGRHQDALSLYSKVLKIDPQNVEAWIGKGQNLAKIARIKEAKKCFNKALEIDPQNVVAQQEKTLLDETCIQDEELRPEIVPPITTEIEETKTVVKESKEWIHKAREQAQLDNNTMAVWYYDQALEVDPQNAEAQEEKARIQEKLDEDKKRRREEKIESLQRRIEGRRERMTQQQSLIKKTVSYSVGFKAIAGTLTLTTYQIVFEPEKKEDKQTGTIIIELDSIVDIRKTSTLLLLSQNLVIQTKDRTVEFWNNLPWGRTEFINQVKQQQEKLKQQADQIKKLTEKLAYLKQNPDSDPDFVSLICTPTASSYLDVNLPNILDSFK